MLLRVIPSIGLVALAACPSFAVGPEAYELLERDGAACEAAGLGSAPCSVFELDNGTVFDDAELQPLRLRFGFESTERNLSHLNLSYERPGQSPVDLTCDFGVHVPVPQGGPSLQCHRVTLSNAADDEADRLTSTARGVLEADLDILADQVGPHALSAWLTDDNGYDSPKLRWQFTVLAPERE